MPGHTASVAARIDAALGIVGPLAVGLAAACYGLVSNRLTVGGAVGAGWGLWQLSMIAVIAWKVVTASDDAGARR